MNALLSLLSLLSDHEVTRMRDRAYREACRERQDARKAWLNGADRTVMLALNESAESAEDFWRQLEAEVRRRAA